MQGTKMLMDRDTAAEVRDLEVCEIVITKGVVIEFGMDRNKVIGAVWETDRLQTAAKSGLGHGADWDAVLGLILQRTLIIGIWRVRPIDPFVLFLCV